MESSTFPPDSETSFTFQVNPVKPCRKVPYMVTAEDVLRKKILALEVISERLWGGNQSDIKLKDFTGEIEDWSHRNNMYGRYFVGQYGHRGMFGMVMTIHAAYCEHYALSLSVSDFIISIGQGLGAHINENTEKLRRYFVEGDGKQTITVERDEFVMGEQNDWSTVFGEFAEQIKKQTKADVYDVMVDDTSVATATSRIVSEITLMEAMKGYFHYRVMTACGIPHITLEGKPEDWQRLKDKVRKLVEMNKDDCLELKWWLDELVPVVDKICEAGIERKADKQFWGSIYKYRSVSGGDDITGWITKFFPYVTMPNGSNKRNDKFLPIKVGMIPKQRCEVPFIWRYLGKDILMKFTAGFFGAGFNMELYQLKPSHFWSVTREDQHLAPEIRTEDL